MNVACVLKTGGHYDASWVWRLRRQVRGYLPSASFVCMSDDAAAPCRVPLEADLPGWWSKLELWRPGVLSGRVLYLDLDTLIVDDLSPLLEYDGPFATLADFWAPGKIQASGVMLWDGDDPPPLWELYHTNPPGRLNPRARFDLWWNRHVVAHELQDLYPGMFVSFKEHCTEAGYPDGASVICFHGRPALTDLHDDHWAAKHWRGA